MARTVDVEVTVKGGREFFNTHSFRKPSYCLLLTLNGEKNCTVRGEKGNKAPKWDQKFVFASDLDSILHIEILCTHDGGGEGHAIGETDINILNVERNKDIDIAFHRKGKKSGEMITAGHITLYLRVALSVTFAVRESKASLRSLHHLNQMDNVLQIMNTTEGRQLSPTWTRLITSLDTVVSYAENISELDSRATVAVSAVAFMVQVLVKQIERDEKVEKLGVVMVDLYTYIRDGIEMDKIETYQKVLDKVLKQTAECAYFIAEYRKVKAFAQRAVINIVSDADNIIAQYEASFGELKISLILGSSLQTAVVSYRILQTVENVESLIHINNLPYLKNVRWDSGRTCLRGTRQELIDEIVQWVSLSGSVDQTSAKHIYVLAGPPGCGKSTVAHTIAEAFHEQKRLGASLFLRGHSGPVNSQTVSSSIIHQLAQYNTVIKARIAEALKSDPSLTDADIGQQFRHLLVGVINTGAPNDDAALAMIGPILIVLDNLHEISEKGEQERILTAIAKDFLKLPPNFRLLLTSRQGDKVTDVLGLIPQHCHIRHTTYDNPSGEAPEEFMTSSLERLASKITGLKDCNDLGKMGKSLLERSIGIQTWIDTLFRFLFFCSERDLWLPGVWQTLHQILSSPIPLSKENAMDNLYRAIFSSLPYPTSLVKHLLLSLLSVGPLSLTEAHEHISLRCIEFTKVIGADHSQGCPILQAMQDLGFVICWKGRSGEGESLCALSPLLLDSLGDKRRFHGTVFPDLEKDSIKVAVRAINIMNDKFRQGRWKKLGSDYTSSFGDDLQVDLQRSCLTWISCIESCGVDCMDDRTTELDPLLTALEEFLTGRILGWMHCLAILTGTSPSSKQMQEPLLQRLECWLKRHLSTTSITGVELPLYLLLQDVRRIRMCDFYWIYCQTQDHSTYSTSETSMEKYISTFIDEVPAVFITSSLERLACKLPELKDCHDLGKMGKSLLERSMGVQTWIDTLFRFLSFCSDRDIWLPGVWQTFHQILSSPIPLSKENAMDNLYCAIFSSFPYPTSLVKDLLLSFLSFGPLFLTEAHEHISLKCVKFTQLSGEDHSQGCPILKVMQELGFVIGRKGKSGDGESFYALSPLLLDSLMNERRCHGTLFPELRKDSIDMAIMTIKVMNDEFRLGRWKNLGSDYTASSGNNLQADLQRSCLTWIFCIESCGVDCMDDRITEFDQLLTTLEEFTAGSILGWMHYLATLRGRSSSKEMQESLLRRLEYWLERHLSMSTSTTDAEKLRMYLLLQDVRRIRGCDFYSISCQKNHSTSEASKEAYSSTFINIAKEQPVCYRDTEYPTVVYRIDRSWLPNRNCVVLQLRYRQRVFHHPAPMGSFRRWASVTRKLPTLNEAIGHAKIKQLTFTIYLSWRNVPPSDRCQVDAQAIIIHDLQPGPKFSQDASVKTYVDGVSSYERGYHLFRLMESGHIVTNTTTNPDKDNGCWHLGEFSYGKPFRVVWTAKDNGFVSLLAPGDRIGVIVESKMSDDMKPPYLYEVDIAVSYMTRGLKL